MRHCVASLPRRWVRPVGVGFFAVPQMASSASSLSRTALRARDALVLEHLALADSIASAMARRLFPPVEREDLTQVAREALVRSVPRCRAGEPAGPYLRRCIAGRCSTNCAIGCGWYAFPIACMSRGNSPSATAASMPALMATPACSTS